MWDFLRDFQTPWIVVEMYPSLYLSYLKCLGVIWDSPIHLARRPIVLRRWMIPVNYIICLCIRDWTFLSVFRSKYRPTSVFGCPKSKVDGFEYHHRWPWKQNPWATSIKMHTITKHRFLFKNYNSKIGLFRKKIVNICDKNRTFFK